MSNTILHLATDRGFANHGWLISHHSFSFANYYNPRKMHFGMLRVLNDDIIAGGMGFGMHPHDNMEIISIPITGSIEHKDSMGNGSIISNGEIQVMSAGTGILHSEFNPHPEQEGNFLQIWIFPNKKNVTPRYDQITTDYKSQKNTLQQIISPNADDEGSWIHQDAWFHIGVFDTDTLLRYNIKKEGNGVYAFVISGNVIIENVSLHDRDALGILDIPEIQINTKTPSEILLIEVPMR